VRAVGRLVANRGNGDCVSSASPLTAAAQPIDIVLVPPPAGGAPQPFVNTAHLADAQVVATTVLINKKPVVVKRSVIPPSSGAPASAIKGATSGKSPNNECTFTGASATVFAHGSPIERHRDTTLQNAANCTGVVKLKEAFSLDGSGMTLDPNMTPAEQEAMVERLEQMYERPRTRELLDRIRADHQARLLDPNATPRRMVLSNYDLDGYAIAPDEAAVMFLGNDGDEINAFNGVGADVWVQVDPTQAADVAGFGLIPADVVLGHELVHSMHAVAGTLMSGTSFGVMPDGSLGGEMLNAELQAMGIGSESNARLAESRFMEERGLPVRRSHDPSEGSYDFAPDKDAIAPQGAATGANGEFFVYCNK
jgi:hypothetical protein